MKIETKDTRQHILDTGYNLVVEKGFTNVGLAQLLKHAQVPKGSFYHYFKSKEQFGEALIEDYFLNYFERLEALFNQESNSAYDNLIQYWKMWGGTDQADCGANKCLVVKLSAEISDLSEPMRLVLMKGANQIVELVANCISAGEQDGSIKVSQSVDTAQFLYNLWLGAALMYKLTKDVSNLEQALHTSERILSGDIVL